MQSDAPFGPKTVLEDNVRDSVKDRRNFRSPMEMQKDLVMLRDENRVLTTPATPRVIRAPRRAALTTTEVPRFDGTTSWEQYHQVFEAIVRSNGWDNDMAAVQLASGRRCVRDRPLSTGGTKVVTIRFSRYINGPLWLSGPAGGL